MMTRVGTPRTSPEKKDRKVAVLHDLGAPVGDDLGQTAGGREHGQRRDEGDELAVGDDDPVDQPAAGAHQQRGDHHDDPVEVLGHRLGRERGRPHRGQRHDRPDREVDAAADDHERHADADHADHRGQPQDRQHVVDGAEPVGGGGGADDAEHRQGDTRPRLRPTGRRGSPARCGARPRRRAAGERPSPSPRSCCPLPRPSLALPRGAPPWAARLHDQGVAPGAPSERAGRFLGQHAAVADDQHPVGQAEHLGDLAGDHDDGHAAVGVPADSA
jgi:hypothetical protein